jgi:arsenical pump membrane protein
MARVRARGGALSSWLRGSIRRSLRGHWNTARSAAGDGVILLCSPLTLVVVVTVVLNLDTSVVFLTPIVLHAARSRGVDERAFLYGTVLMSNSASLLLPGSNLTNLSFSAATTSAA